MARSDSVINLNGTIDNLTFVKSRTYGKHVRAKRGTYRVAKVNKAFKAESVNLIGANVPAGIFKAAIDLYRADMMGGLLWQQLVSMFRKQRLEYGVYDFSKLPSFEIHERYPFDRFLRIQIEIKHIQNKGVIRVELPYSLHPSFGKSTYVDGYRLGVIGIFPDLKKKKAKTDVVYSRTIGLKDELTPVILDLPVPARAKCFVLCLKIDGCVKGVVNKTAPTKGMKVVKAGKI